MLSGDGAAMQMLYNSDQFVVVQFEMLASAVDPAPAQPALARGGYEIVDKLARREIFIEGAVAEGFREGVEALMRKDPSADDLDEFIGRYTVLAVTPLALH
jgi:Protein of unknown function (DUF3567)